MEKLLLEINRYKQLMNIVLLTEGGKAVDEILPISPKSVDNLTKQGVDFANDLSILSDEFTNLGIKTFDDLTKVVASKNPTINPKNITDDMIKSYIKNDETLYKSILAKAAAAAAAEADILVKNANLTALFRADPVQLANIQRLLGVTPGIRTIDTLIQGVDDSIVSIEKTINDIQMGKVPGVTTVPRELEELYDQLISKKLDLTNYKNKDVTPNKVVDNLSSTYKWGRLGDNFTISDKITNYLGRYVVMVKEGNGRLRPFYQRTGGGGEDQEWAAKGNWVPFYGIADVTLINEEGLLKRINGWMIKPENGRVGEDGDENISKLIANVAGTNGIKDVDYDIGNFSKSITNTTSHGAMNDWLRAFGYEIDQYSGYLRIIKLPNVLHGIP